MKVEKPAQGMGFVTSSVKSKKETEFMCLLVSEKELDKKEVEKLHHQYGHGKLDRVAKHIKNAGKMTESVQGWIDGIKARCLSCKLDQPRKPLPQYSLPRATKFN